MTQVLNPDLAEQVWGADAAAVSACMSCGVCSAVCPMGINLLPRTVFRHVLLGMEDRVLAESETVFSCLLCKLCEVNCPADVPVAERVRVLRRFLNHRSFSL